MVTFAAFDARLTLTEEDLSELKGFKRGSVFRRSGDGLFTAIALAQSICGQGPGAVPDYRPFFWGKPVAKVPFVIGIAGSVAVGKSTTARILKALLSRWPNHPRVDLVTTDGFLLPNHVLEERGLMRRKGFPESYDQRALLKFMADIKSGKREVSAPLYSHLVYDVLPDERATIRQPDIVILEGLNVLQRSDGSSKVYISDFFDFSIYVDAHEADLENWFVGRFMKLRETAFTDEKSFFRHFAELSKAEAQQTAVDIWRSINLVNLKDNIAPTKRRSSLILQKGETAPSGRH